MHLGAEPLTADWDLFARMLPSSRVGNLPSHFHLSTSNSLCSCWPSQWPSVLCYSDSFWQPSSLQFLPQGMQSHWVCGATLYDTGMHSFVRNISPPLSLPFMRCFLRDLCPSDGCRTVMRYCYISFSFSLLISLFSYVLLILPQSSGLYNR